MPENLKAQRLNEGNTIGIISPSWGGAGYFPHRVEKAQQHLASLGFEVKFAKHALNAKSFVSDTALNRAQDINDMFADSSIKAIIAAIGGDHSCHLLPYLDFELIAKNPKIFMGYSDVTVLNIAIWQKTGLITFNGPTIVTDFAEQPTMFPYTERYFLAATTSGQATGVIEPSSEWTEEFQDFEQKLDLERPRIMQKSSGWNYIKEGRATGKLLGGCLESLQHLRGTPYWPNWDDAIFFFETSEEKPSPETVDGLLMDYENMGVFEKLKDLLVGRPMYYSSDEKQMLNERILERTEACDFPIITNMDFGHTAPQFTLPIGCQAIMDSTEKRFEIIETAVIGKPTEVVMSLNG